MRPIGMKRHEGSRTLCDVRKPRQIPTVHFADPPPNPQDKETQSMSEASSTTYLTDECIMMRDLGRSFTREHVTPLANKLDLGRGDIPRDFIARMEELGFFGILISENYGGLGLGARSHRGPRKNTILACGAFEGNPAMIAQYTGPNARFTRPVAPGGWYNKGEGI
jgi:hypothetical protein